ncbi:2-hydroxy-3-keto-5-methylthiopentenyl-1-phosphate phosphatase [Oxobacter pfennigii]|uniref:2-hydroxy-3-keto-5-methylthiopentenyl-1-phosphate phosphatase n=1 Tax=Oxobacter pfennigii TaxID=36849 RepID=A0A0P8WDY7_9CLOT|nr:MtnX-like HAD-IB family phosphatase [Oxobacter pfennigii]KPU45951.1 2-hydroxy-3-keto-5-methylthiopentenyl-1-phosphate phosphatase [Oxobacter pfennigii]
MKKLNNKPVAVICDFDGTISLKDVNTAIFEHFGNEETRTIEQSYRGSLIGLRESLQTQYEKIRVSEEDFFEYVDRYMEIDSAYFDMLDYARDNNILTIILSGGFINYVKRLFNKYGRSIDIPVFSNSLEIKDGIMAAKYGEVPDCIKDYGPCGICKYKYMMQYKDKFSLVYVGDGFTDRCAAEAADVVFAKDNLAVFCLQNNIEYINYKSFRDVLEYLENLPED